MLLCCWLAAVGAGLLKSEEILEGVARLRLSNDIEFEEETFLAMMNEAREVNRSLIWISLSSIMFNEVDCLTLISGDTKLSVMFLWNVGWY